MDTEKIIEMYLAFRSELDKIWVPILINANGEKLDIRLIKCEGEIAGMIIGTAYYIDCVYILPEFRRRGLAREAVLKWYDDYKVHRIKLHIVNDNMAAFNFWKKLFDLKCIERNITDGLYEIKGLKMKEHELCKLRKLKELSAKE